VVKQKNLLEIVDVLKKGVGKWESSMTSKFTPHLPSLFNTHNTARKRARLWMDVLAPVMSGRRMLEIAIANEKAHYI